MVYTGVLYNEQIKVVLHTVKEKLDNIKSILSVQQTTTSTADGGENVVTIMLSDGTPCEVKVRNGSKGSVGATGPQGPKGDTGATGAKGAKGDTGATGPQGPKGDTGAAGPQGPKGDTGAAGAKGATGAAGARGSQWYSGTAITGTSATATVFSGSGVTSALVGDYYLNTTTGNVYRCTTAGAASAARWVYSGSIKGATGAKGATGSQGPKGDTGATGPQGAKGAAGATGPQGVKGATGAPGVRGSQIYQGTAITGTSTTAIVFSGSGISSALVNDLYINASTYNVYQCTTAGAASAAKWAYRGCIKGAKGATGATGPQGPKGDTGATGAKGATGATGPQGPKGDTGAAGKDGACNISYDATNKMITIS